MGARSSLAAEPPSLALPRRNGGKNLIAIVESKRVEALRVGASDFVFRSGGEIFAIKEFLHQLV